jgi:hypothetical protein
MSRVACRLIAAFLSINLLFVAPIAEARDAAAHAPALWKIDGPKGDIYLFGAVHLLPRGVAWRTPALEAALNDAQVLVFEIDIDAGQNIAATQALIAKLGMLPPETTLRKLLAPQHRTKFERVAASLGLPPAALDGFRPWLAALTIGVQWIVSKGHDPNSGVDQQIWNWSKQTTKQRAALETPEQQLEAFAGLTRAQEVEFLLVTLDQIEQTPQMLDDLVKAWRKGDTEALDNMLNDGMEDLPALSRLMFNDRHARWLPQIDKMIADGRTHVIVVGTAHLVGKDSIIAMLRAKGVTVEGP